MGLYTITMTAFVTPALIILTNYLMFRVVVLRLGERGRYPGLASVNLAERNICASNTFYIDVINKCHDESVIPPPPNIRKSPHIRPNYKLTSIARSDMRHSHLRKVWVSYRDITSHRRKLSTTVLLIIIILLITVLISF